MIKKILVWVTGFCLLGSAAWVSASQEIVDRVVAVINDDIITLSQLHKAVQPYLTQVTSSSKSEIEKKQMIASMEKQMLNTMIDRTLTRQEAVRQQISVSDDDVASAIENFKQQRGLDQEALEKGLESEGISLEEYRERVREDIMQSLLVNRVIRSRIIVTQADIEAYYQAHPEDFKRARKYHLRNILAATEAEARNVLSRLDQGLSFPEAARQFSQAPNAEDGGDLGVFEIQTINDTIKSVVQPLKKGDYSGVIPTGQGFQIVYVEDIIETGGKGLDQVKDEIQDILYQKQGEEKFSQWIESLKKNAHIKVML